METCIGIVTHYYNRIGVAVLLLSGELKTSDVVHVLGRNTDFFQKAWSMEIEHRKVQCVGPGAEVALRVAEPVRRGDKVYLAEATTPLESRDTFVTTL